MPVLSAEVQLLGWAKSTSKSGPKVVLLLQSDDEIAFFESLTLAKGKTAGQILDVNFKLSLQDDQSQEAEALESFKRSDDYRVAVASGIFQDKADEPADDSFLTAKDLPKPPTGLRCREAVGLSNEKDFWVYAQEKSSDKKSYPFGFTATVNGASGFIKSTCEIESRREFDEGPDADEKYARFCAIKTAYRKWQERKK